MMPLPVGVPGLNNSGKGLIQLIEVQNGLIHSSPLLLRGFLYRIASLHLLIFINPFIRPCAL
jgi:hypothetical protein